MSARWTVKVIGREANWQWRDCSKKGGCSTTCHNQVHKQEYSKKPSGKTKII